jgi:lysophospholipase L1-like esterase
MDIGWLRFIKGASCLAVAVAVIAGISMAVEPVTVGPITIGQIKSAYGATTPSSPNQVRLEHVAIRLATRQPLRIIAFGSSSTEGAGASSAAASYPSRLLVDLTAAVPPPQQITVLNRGIGGEDADDMIRRLPKIIAEHPDLIIWQTGTNDPLRALPLDRFQQETIAGIKAIQAAHIDLMLMEPQLCRELDGKPYSYRYRDALRGIAEDMNVPLIRRYDMMRTWLTDGVLTPAQMLAPDGLHMTDGGYAKLAEAVAADILHRAATPVVALGSTPHL